MSLQILEGFLNIKARLKIKNNNKRINKQMVSRENSSKLDELNGNIFPLVKSKANLSQYGQFITNREIIHISKNLGIMGKVESCTTFPKLFGFMHHHSKVSHSCVLYFPSNTFSTVNFPHLFLHQFISLPIATTILASCPQLQEAFALPKGSSPQLVKHCCTVLSYNGINFRRQFTLFYTLESVI